eukprot:507314_1
MSHKGSIFVVGCCSVCYQPLCLNLKVGPCGHIYHSKCVIKLCKSKDIISCTECGYETDYERFMDALSDFVPDPERLVDPSFMHQIANYYENIKNYNETNHLSISFINDTMNIYEQAGGINLCQNPTQPCIVITNHQIQFFDNTYLCSNCCMKLLILTNSLKTVYAAHCKTKPISYRRGIVSFLMHPQVVLYFSRDKQLYKFVLEMIIEASWFSDVAINDIYTLTTLNVVGAQIHLRLILGQFLELCQNKKQLLRFIKLEGGKYFDNCILGYLRQMPRFFEMMQLNDKHCSDEQFECWAASNRWPYIAYHVAVKIVYKYGNYFWLKAYKHSIRTGNKLVFKGCYKYIAELFFLLPEFQKCYKEWVEYAFYDGQFHSKSKAYKWLLFNYSKNVVCNNPKCNINYGNYVYSISLPKKFKVVFELPKPKRKWYTCSNCKLVWYCTRKCQKYDWNRFNHKKLCCHFRH